MSDYWSNYWQQGHLTSFGHDLSGNYQGPLAERWQQLFTRLAQGATVVDIATGNGALIALGEQQSKDKVTWHGIDSADLFIGKALQQANIRFWPNTPAETLPFEDKSIDGVISQFGIEYTDVNKTLYEIARVLNDNGNVKFVIHHIDSYIVQPNISILAAAKAIMQDNGPLTALSQLIHALVQSTSSGDRVEKLNNALSQQLEKLVNHHRDGLYGTNFGQFLQAIMAHQGQGEKRLAMLASFEKETLLLIERLTDLASAARSESQIAEMQQQLQDALQREVVVDVIKDEQGHLLAWDMSCYAV